MAVSFRGIAQSAVGKIAIGAATTAALAVCIVVIRGGGLPR